MGRLAPLHALPGSPHASSTPAFSLARRLRAGETVPQRLVRPLPSIVAEIVGREGFPAVTLDGQHGLWDTASILTAVAAIRAGGAAPIVRIPVGEFASVSRALDFGPRASSHR